jgi:hypothetical protein
VAKYDWDKLKAKYVAGEYKSLRDFAEREKINYDVLRRKASKWQNEKSQASINKVTKTVTKTVEKLSTKEANRNVRLFSLADKLANKLEQAIEQVDQYIVTNKVKTKTIEYDHSIAKPKKEVVVEEEVKEIVGGIIDKQGLKFLTAALKDIKDIQSVSEEKQKLELEKMKAEIKKISGEDTKLEAIAAHNAKLNTLASLINNAVPDRPASDYEEEDDG